MKNVVNKVTTAGAVVREGKILVVQRALDDDSYPGLWELPSGKKEPLESVTDAVTREVREETQLEVKPLDVVFTFNFTVEKPDEIRDFTQLIFAVEEVAEKEVVLSEEHKEFKWITQDELDTLNISDETKAGIKKVFAYLSK